MSTRHAPRHSTAAPPPLWVMLARAHQIDAPLAKAWWIALCRSRWQETCAWRQAVMLHGELGDPERFSATVWTPQRLIGILEALCQERLLDRHSTTRLEEALFVCVSATGTWL